MSTPNPTLTTAQLAIWFPPVGQTEGVPIPGTIVNPFTKTNIPDTPENRFNLAWCASQPLAKQPLYDGIIDSENEEVTPNTIAAQQSLCQQLYAEGYLIFLPTDFRQKSPYDSLQDAASYGFATVPAGNPATAGPVPNGSFSTSLRVTDYQPAPWAVAALTPVPSPGATNPVGAYQGGAPEGTPGALYGNAAGSPYNASTASGTQVKQNGATYAAVPEVELMGSSIEWMLIIPAAVTA